MKTQTTRRQFLIASGTAAAATLTAGTRSAESLKAPAIINRGATLADVDVLVVGGGPAGIGACLGAARKGAKTLLIENHSFFGGVAAWAMGMQMNQMRPGGKPRSRIHELLIGKLKAYGGQAMRLGQHEIWCNVEYLKVAVLDALDQVGCRYFVHVRAADAIVEKNRVSGVVVATKQGLQTLRAKVVVDCTGDGDVAYYAGAETMIDPQALMPMTLGLTLTNIDRNVVRPADVEKAMHQAKSKHPLIPSGFIEIKQVAPVRVGGLIMPARLIWAELTQPTLTSARKRSASVAARRFRWSTRCMNQTTRRYARWNGVARGRR